MKHRKTGRKILWAIAAMFVVMNIVAFNHAYKFTHFTASNVGKTPSPAKLSTIQKIKTIVFGVGNPKPLNNLFPKRKFETIVLQSNKKIECWSIKAENPKGTIILFHGYSGNKSSMLDKSDEFLKLGYSTFVVDFMGSGGSEGNQTTIGFKEAEEVKTCYDYLKSEGEENICLFGTSMGAVAILNAISDYNLNPNSIIIECPFGSMKETIDARFSAMGIPSFPMAPILGFWGSVQNGFWVNNHNPTEYAKKVKCPTLLLYGEKDQRVSKNEIDEIFMNLNGKKILRTYPLAGHENYLSKYEQKWVSDIQSFLLLKE